MKRWADSCCAALEKTVPRRTPHGKALQLAVRATLLDADAYREIARDASLNTAAVVLALVGMIAAWMGTAFLSSLTGVAAGLFLKVAIFQAGAFVGFVAGASMALTQTTGRKRQPLEVFRATAFAQAPGVLAILPVVGPLASLWRLPTTIVALKEGFNVQLAQAIVALLVGGIAGWLATLLLNPIVF